MKIIKNLSAVLFAFILTLCFSLVCLGVDVAFEVKNETLTVTGSGEISVEDANKWSSFSGAVKNVVISEGITSVPDDAFIGFELTEIRIAETVTKIGAHAFGYQTDGVEYTTLGTPTVIGAGESEAQNYAIANSLDFSDINEGLPSGTLDDLKWSVSPNGKLTVSGSGAMQDFPTGNGAPWADYFAEKDGVKITCVLICDGITGIGANAFAKNNDITQFEIAQSVRTVGADAFGGCGLLESVSLPGAESVGSGAFAGLENLETVSLPLCKTVGESCFDGSSVKNITLSQELSVVPNGAFRGCYSLVSLTLPGVTEIGTAAFEDCEKLERVKFGQVRSVGVNGFSGCKSLISFPFSDSLVSMGENAFFYCASLSSVTIGRGMTVIPACAFEGCETLSNLVISDTVTEICERAFTNCPLLHTVTLSKNIRKLYPKCLGFYYFSDEKITGIYGKYNDFNLLIKAPSPSLAEVYAKEYELEFESTGQITSDSGTFGNGIKWTVKLPAGTLLVSGSGAVMPDFDSPADTPWFVYGDYIKGVTLTGVNYVGNHAFDGVEAELLNVPSSTVRIGDFAFAGMRITSLALPGSLTDIGDSAFENCTLLSSVSMPGTLKNIGENCFKGTSLSSVYIPASVEYVGSYAVGYDADGNKIENFLIKGVGDSIANAYADENGIRFRVDGYVTVTDEVSGATLNMIGGEDDEYVFLFEKIDTPTSPTIFKKQNENLYFYRMSLTVNGVDTLIDGTATVALPIPSGIKPLLVDIYKNTSAAEYEKISVDVSEGAFRFDVNSLGIFVISDADLSNLYKITVKNGYSDGSEVVEEIYAYATDGAEYTIPALSLEGYVSDRESASGRIDGSDVEISFVYTKTESTSDVTSEVTDDGGKTEERGPNVIIILEIIVIVILIIIVAILIYMILKKRRISQSEEMSEKRFTTADRFGDTIVVPFAADAELDISSLFNAEDDDDVKIVPSKNVSKAIKYGATVNKIVPKAIILKRFKGKTMPVARKSIAPQKKEK